MRSELKYPYIKSMIILAALFFLSKIKREVASGTYTPQNNDVLAPIVSSYVGRVSERQLTTTIPIGDAQLTAMKEGYQLSFGGGNFLVYAPSLFEGYQYHIGAGVGSIQTFPTRMALLTAHPELIGYL